MFRHSTFNCFLNHLYINNLYTSFYFQLFSTFSVALLFLGTFLFLVCFFISFLFVPL